MAWEWSHTDEAYFNAEQNMRGQSTEWLQEVLSEILANKTSEGSPLTEHFKAAEREIATAKNAHILNDTMDEWSIELATKIWEFAEGQATCNNGGFEAWCCPFGCHTVPFDLVCSICGNDIEEEYNGWTGGHVEQGRAFWRSHNAFPINRGRCCGNCNAIEVLPARMRAQGILIN
jgi:hypothetical protein